VWLGEGGRLDWAQHTLAGRVELFQLLGDLDMASAPPVERAVVEVVEAGRRLLLFDLMHLAILDSTGLRLFSTTYRMLRDVGGAVAVASPRPHVRQVFEITGTDELIRICPTRIDALRHLTSIDI
jgi:anti-sigma B factor antagonist